MPVDSEGWTPKVVVDRSVSEVSDATLVVEEHRFANADHDVRVVGCIVNAHDRSQPVTVTVERFRDADTEKALAEEDPNRAGLDAGDGWGFAHIITVVGASEITLTRSSPNDGNRHRGDVA